jgi:hypothetical protein
MTTTITASIKTIKALIALDSHPGIATALMSTAFELQPEHAKYLAIPMQKSIPGWLNRVIILDRIDKVADELEMGIVGQYATHSEVLAFLYYYKEKKGNLEEWNDLYFALLRRVMQKYKINIPDFLNIPDISIDQVPIVFLSLATTVRQLLIEGNSHE